MPDAAAGLGLLDLLRLGGALLAVVALAVLAGRLARRGGFGRKTASIAIRDRLHVARGVQLALVEVEGRRLLVGIGDRGAQLVTELAPLADDEAAAADAAVSPAPRPLPPAMAFATRLAAALKRQGA